MKLSKTLVAILAATALLCTVASSASASRLSFSGTRLDVTWARLTLNGGFDSIECEVTLSKSLHSSTLAKESGLLIGYVTAANVNRCTGGTARVLRERLPWHVRYSSFAGSLPNITSIQTRVIGLALEVTDSRIGLQCLLTSSVTEPMIMTYNRDASGRLTSVTAGGTIRCGVISVTLSGTGSVNAVTLTLI